MRVLWICNFMLPVICQALHRTDNRKEGWISGLLTQLLQQKEEEPELSVAFPVGRELLPDGKNWQKEVLEGSGGRTLSYYCFYEDTEHPWNYDASLEQTMKELLAQAQPDVLHLFGTEYPHTLAAVRAFGKRERTLIGIQGLCSVYAQAYMANLPEKVQGSVTFRDLVKGDTLKQQQQKFVQRGEYEKEAVALAGHLAGRTDWDRHYTGLWNPEGTYHVLKETLRPTFYEGEWQYDACEKHRIFVSQGNYPIKGLHYVLLALPEMIKSYADTRVFVAGDCLLRDGPLGCLKISAYGRYLQTLIRQNRLEEHVVFLGNLGPEEMKEQYLKCQVFLCPSSIENSPNSLGEAMVLKTPVVTADVGGIPSMIADDECFLYEGFRKEQEGEAQRIASALAQKVGEAFSLEEKVTERTNKAYRHGMENHSGADNVEQLLTVYREIAGGK